MSFCTKTVINRPLFSSSKEILDSFQLTSTFEKSKDTAHFEINDKNDLKKTQNREIVLSRYFTHQRGSRIHSLEHLPSFRRTVVENPLEETHSFPLECGKKDEYVGIITIFGTVRFYDLMVS